MRERLVQEMVELLVIEALESSAEINETRFHRYAEEYVDKYIKRLANEILEKRFEL